MTSDGNKEKKLTSKFPDTYKDNSCKCGRLTFSHVKDVHLDGTDDELNQRMEDIHRNGGRQYRESNK
jgi:hypothetical protein